MRFRIERLALRRVNVKVMGFTGAAFRDHLICNEL